MDEFKILKVKFSQESKSAHHLFYKKYKPNRNDDLDKQISTNSFEKNSDLAARTLLVVGVPSYLNSQAVKNLFSCFGQIDHVLLYAEPNSLPFSSIKNGKKPTSIFDVDESKLGCFKVAYIVYNQIGSVEKSLNKPVAEERIALTKQQPISVGFKKWTEDYKNSFLDEKKIQKDVDSFMQSFDEAKSKKDQEELEKTNQPDEEGWITVTSKHRKANRTLTERNIEKLKSKQKKRTQKMQLIHFYNFQAKDSKRDYIVQLRKRFEDDKKQIEEMKKNRKFKPF